MLGLLALSISILLHLSVDQYIKNQGITDITLQADTYIKGYIVTFTIFLILGTITSFIEYTRKIGFTCLIVALLEFYKVFCALFTKYIASGNAGKEAGFWIFGLVLLIINAGIIGFDAYKTQDKGEFSGSNIKHSPIYDKLGYIAGGEFVVLIIIVGGLSYSLWGNKSS